MDRLLWTGYYGPIILTNNLYHPADISFSQNTSLLYCISVWVYIAG